MNILIFNGALEKRTLSTSHTITSFLKEEFDAAGADVTVFHLAEAGIPFLDITLNTTPRAVTAMAGMFKRADIHVWLTPLYHGSMTGAMKNCLDWLEITSGNPLPYLTDKTIGMVCWADGGRAMLGIQTMENVAQSLRAWVHPYSVPIVKKDLYELEYSRISPEYTAKLKRLANLLINGSKS